MAQRPRNFRLNPLSHLAQGLVFAGLGKHVGTEHYYDSSLHANHDTLTNMAPSSDWGWANELNRFALGFDGSNDYALATVLTDDASLADPFTISCWAIADDTVGGKGIISHQLGANWTTPNFIIQRNANAVRAYAPGKWTTTSTITVGEPFHCTYTYEGNATRKCHFYLNGSYVGSATGILDMVASRGDKLWVGNGYNGYFLGDVSDVMVHRRELSLPEIAALADPSNVMLSGLLEAPARRWWPVSSGGAGAPAWMWARQHHSRVIGGGTI